MEKDPLANILEGNWKQLKGKIRQTWGDLTDDEVDQINGRREELVGKIQAKYGRTRAEAEAEVDDFLNTYR